MMNLLAFSPTHSFSVSTTFRSSFVVCPASVPSTHSAKCPKRAASRPVFLPQQSLSTLKSSIQGSSHPHESDSFPNESKNVFPDNSASIPGMLNTDIPHLEDGGTGSGTGQGAGSGGNSSFGKGDQKHEGSGDLPEDLRTALACGSLSSEALNRYFQALKNPFSKLLMAIPAYRTRALADSSFFFKLMAQEVIGNGTALASEIAVRGNDIVHELEYVASDLIVGTVVEAAFVWLLAPTLLLPKTSGSSISKYLSRLPANVFQSSTSVQAFTLSQRIASFFYAGAQYAAIGFVAGIVGTAITYAIIEGRKRLETNYKPERPLPAVLPNSAAWGSFMAVSSNTRFQIVEGMELGIAKLFVGKAQSFVNASIIALRLANNYWGGVQFVQFFRYIGLHATGEQSNAH